MYSSNAYSSFNRSSQLNSWADTCGDVLGEASAVAVTGLTRIMQLPFAGAAFLFGEITDSFIRASDNVGDAVGREAGRFVGKVIGAGAEALATAISRTGSALFDYASIAFNAAINAVRWPF